MDIFDAYEKFIPKPEPKAVEDVGLFKVERREDPKPDPKPEPTPEVKQEPVTFNEEELVNKITNRILEALTKKGEE